MSSSMITSPWRLLSFTFFVAMKGLVVFLLAIIFAVVVADAFDGNKVERVLDDDLDLTYETAEQMIELPLHCYRQKYPFKFTNTLNNVSDVVEPSVKIPIFSGCYDWHSSVHGHWLMAAMINRYPDTELAEKVLPIFDAQFKDEMVQTEVEFFKTDKSFERTYGWSWFLKLYLELKASPFDANHGWSKTLKPLADHIVEKYKDFLPKLVYPLRIGTHANTAFGLIFPIDYTDQLQDEELRELVEHNATNLFMEDKGCPLTWEPSGTDFLSPCFQEADLVGRVVHNPVKFEAWLREFLPQIFEEDFHLEPAEVIDRTDGHLVHLDGLNFSRAWNLYSILYRLGVNTPQPLREKLMSTADEHIMKSKEFVVGSDYVGSHWLASFLVYALQMREKALEELQ